LSTPFFLLFQIFQVFHELAFTYGNPPHICGLSIGHYVWDPVAFSASAQLSLLNIILSGNLGLAANIASTGSTAMGVRGKDFFLDKGKAPYVYSI